MAVEIANLIKARKKAKTEEEKIKIDKLRQEKKVELYRRSPILYAAYEIKDRSDNFIRSGIGLSNQTQVDRNKHSLSAVGNKDVMNEFIYKSLVTHLENEVQINESLSKEQIIERYKKMNTRPEFVELYLKYIEFKKEQNEAILGLPGNPGVVFPEIYTIVNFIGIFSNTELTHLAKIGGIIDKYENEFLTKMQALLSDERYYDSSISKFTEVGLEKKDELINEYGAEIELDISLEEEGKSPLASDESMLKTLESGYIISGFESFQEEIDKTIEEVSNDSKYFDIEVSKSNETLNAAGQQLGNLILSIENPEKAEEFTSATTR